MNPSKEKKILLTNVPLYECGSFYHGHSALSVSWNSTGSLLASSSSQGGVKFWPCPSPSDSNHHIIREITALDHRSQVERVRFHPSEPNLICTNVRDRSIQLWDVRTNGTSKSLHRIDLKSKVGACASCVEWLGGNRYGKSGIDGGKDSFYLVVTEKDDSVHIYDTRKLHPGNNPSSSGCTPVKSFNLAPHEVTETHFSPSGSHLISAVRNGYDNMGSLIIYPWKNNNHDTTNNGIKISDMLSSSAAKMLVGHTGKLFSIKFSPNGQLLATGGGDAIVGLWDVPSMVCTSTILRRSKLIRSVCYSHDSKLVACSTGEDGVDVSNSVTGELLHNINLSRPKAKNDKEPPAYGGADEITFHPKYYLLACARGDDYRGGGVPEVTIASIPNNARSNR